MANTKNSNRGLRRGLAKIALAVAIATGVGVVGNNVYREVSSKEPVYFPAKDCFKGVPNPSCPEWAHNSQYQVPLSLAGAPWTNGAEIGATLCACLSLPLCLMYKMRREANQRK